MNASDKIRYLIINVQFIHANIRFADTKAAVYILVLTSLLAYLGSAFSKLNNAPPDWQYFIFSALVFGLAFASTGLILVFMVIRPRGGRIKNRGLGHIHPIRINQYRGSDEYIANALKKSDDEIIQEIYEVIYDYSYIDERKYYWLRMSLFPLTGTFIISGLIFALTY